MAETATAQILDEALDTPIIMPPAENVPTAPEADYIDPNAPRWVFLPIQDLIVEGRDFRMDTIPSMTFVPLTIFSNPVDTERGRIMVPRTPFQQLTDAKMKTVEAERELVDLIEVSRLENIDDQVKVLSVLTSRNVCAKYPYELNNGCATCWVKDIEDGLEERVLIEFKDRTDLQDVARKSAKALYEGLTTAITEANLKVNIAKEMLDDKTAGKARMYDTDMANIYHTHQELPKFRTTTDAGTETADAMKQSAEAMMTIAEKAGGGMSREEVKELLKDAQTARVERQDKEIADLKKKLATLEASGEEKDG